MLFSYKAIDTNNQPREGTVDAKNVESAIETVQGRGYTIISVDPVNEKHSILDFEITWFDRVSNKEVVILSRQIATLFDAQVSALRVFRLLAAENENLLLQKTLNEVADELQGGSSISRALSSHSDIFSPFYVSMVRAGEEAGNLEQTFMYLADYLDRTYEVMTKARNALIYPAFVIGVFVVVMTLMLTLVIPRLADVVRSVNQDLPIYTKVILGLSDFFAQFIGLILVFLTIAAVIIWQFIRTDAGKRALDELKLAIPYVGSLYEKLYLTRICDNLSTMLQSGISMVHALEITAEVVDNSVYKEIIEHTILEVKGGRPFADSIAEYPEIPGVLAQMSKIGEETGKLGEILTTLSLFYRREVNNAVDTLINMIEPAMIVLLGLGVGILIASVLVPIYNITAGI